MPCAFPLNARDLRKCKRRKFMTNKQFGLHCTSGIEGSALFLTFFRVCPIIHLSVVVVHWRLSNAFLSVRWVGWTGPLVGFLYVASIIASRAEAVIPWWIATFPISILIWWQLLNKATIQQRAHKPTIHQKWNRIMLYYPSPRGKITQIERNMQKRTSTSTWTKVREMQVMTVFILVFGYNWLFAGTKIVFSWPHLTARKSRTQYFFSPHQSEG